MGPGRGGRTKRAKKETTSRKREIERKRRRETKEFENLVKG
jgi:hypothetical protein